MTALLALLFSAEAFFNTTSDASSPALSPAAPVESVAGRLIYVDGSLAQNCAGTYSLARRDCSGRDGDAYRALEEVIGYYHNAQTYVPGLALKPGDKVEIRSGTYTHNRGVGSNKALFGINASGASGNPITVEAYNNEQVILDAGGNLLNTLRISGNYLVVRGLEIKGAAGSGVIGNNVHDVTLDKLVVHDNNEEWRRSGGKFASGIDFFGGSNLTVTNSEIYHNGGGIGFSEGVAEDVATGVRNCRAEGNTIYDNTHTSNPGNSSGLGSRFGDACVYRRNVIYGNPDAGINGLGVTNTLVEENVVLRNFVSGSSGNAEQVKMEVRGGGGNVYRRNLIVGPAAAGLTLGRCFGCVVIDNEIRENDVDIQADWSRAGFFFNNQATEVRIKDPRAALTSSGSSNEAEIRRQVAEETPDLIAAIRARISELAALCGQNKCASQEAQEQEKLEFLVGSLERSGHLVTRSGG